MRICERPSEDKNIFYTCSGMCTESNCAGMYSVHDRVIVDNMSDFEKKAWVKKKNCASEEEISNTHLSTGGPCLLSPFKERIITGAPQSQLESLQMRDISPVILAVCCPQSQVDDPLLSALKEMFRCFRSCCCGR